MQVVEFDGGVRGVLDFERERESYILLLVHLLTVAYLQDSDLIHMSGRVAEDTHLTGCRVLVTHSSEEQKDHPFQIERYVGGWHFFLLTGCVTKVGPLRPRDRLPVSTL